MKRLSTATLCLFFLLSWYVPFSFGAVANDTFCGTGATTVVVFGNGIMNNEDDVEDSLKILRNSLQASLSNEEFSKLEFKVAYNRSYGFWGDLYESLRQRRASDNFSVSFWRWIGGTEVVPDDVRQHINEAVANFDVSEHLGGEDIANHIALYRASTSEGKKVLLVSHSQGNLFANAAYQVLYNGPDRLGKRSFGIVAVATPASFVAGNGSYVTLAEDTVISTVAASSLLAGTVPPLASNVTNIGDGTGSGDWKGHSFVDAYMVANSRSAERILSNVVALAALLEVPNQIAQEGIITVTLSWGSQPDVDLHVMEPGDNHVYYNHRTGIHGYLDVDDLNGYGPEHYYVACGDLGEGTYKVGVNYYYGLAPEQALVQIKAGGSIRSYQVVLPQSRGSLGNNSPVQLANVVVSGNTVNGFKFDINSLQ